MKISEIYKEYKIMPSLQLHQYRVAAVGKLICENLGKKFKDTDYVVSALLLHDMGNIIKFDLNFFPEFLKPEGLEYWQNIKDEFIEKYGNDETEATLQISKELDVSLTTYDLICSIGFSKLNQSIINPNIAFKIVSYADSRVTPFGIVPALDRINEGQIRFERNSKIKSDKKHVEEQSKALIELENQIFKNLEIDPEDINETSTATIVKELSEFELI